MGSGLESSGAQHVEGDDPGQPALPGLSFSYKGPLPPPGLLAEYERLVPGTAAWILRTGEASLQAEIDQDVIPVKAEARALVAATIAVSYFPWVAIIGAVALIFAGEQGAAVVAGVAGLVTIGPQVIQATRKPR